jgi:hypothetical protein
MNPLLLEGLADAVGFVAGTVAGYGLGLTFGRNIFAAGHGKREHRCHRAGRLGRPATTGQALAGIAPYEDPDA